MLTTPASIRFGYVHHTGRGWEPTVHLDSKQDPTSRDAAEEAVAEFLKRDPRIIVYHKSMGRRNPCLMRIAWVIDAGGGSPRIIPIAEDSADLRAAETFAQEALRRGFLVLLYQYAPDAYFEFRVCATTASLLAPTVGHRHPPPGLELTPVREKIQEN